MLKIIKKNIFFTILIPLMSLNVFSSDKTLTIEEGQKWVLETRSNKLSPATSKVLYFFSTDAYNTYHARIFSDWSSFSVVDGRNLVRLNKGDQIEVIKSVHQSKVYEVKLLTGYEKNRKYFVIKDDLLNDYILSEKKDEA
ncbi:MAG: hypothetical protein CMD46_04875 [Gammaproteobacteria bacterium]|nr:hypothetical protein [Gammaproteobacteria bacterium]|tara:strand:+ start:1450 stop:1869 length:420 start_codon:yes stop_codon:yes gene_type:complete